MNRPFNVPQSFSPFAEKQMDFGYSGVSVDKSGRTLSVGNTPRAITQFSPANSGGGGAAPLTVSMTTIGYLRCDGSCGYVDVVTGVTSP